MEDPSSETPKQLRQWVLDRLRSDILEGRLQAAEWLRQDRLAQEYGVSQTPVREALKQLAAEGLVEHIPYRGIQIVKFSLMDAEDLYQCRAAIEGIAARFAAESITEAEIAEVQSLHTRMLACPMPDGLPEYRKLNRQFHERITGASRRPFLFRMINQVWGAFPTMLWSNIPGIALTSTPERDEPDAAEHAEIVAALTAHDSDRAETAVRAHIESAGRTLINAMAAQP
jgi:DNA-binding GntR family transcriptional regulator